MNFLRKNYGNLLMLALLALVLIPATGTPIKVAMNRLISFSPSPIDEDRRETIGSYNWSLIDQDGKPANLEDSRGKVILVNSWATWCPPCIAEMPELQSLFNDYGDKIAFYLISNEPIDRQSAFLNKKGYNLPIYRPYGSAPEMLSSSSLPTTWLIDTNGKLVIKKTGAAKWNSLATRELIDGLLIDQ